MFIVFSLNYLYWKCINSDEVNTLEMLCCADASLVFPWKNCKVNVGVFNFRDKGRYRSRSHSHDGRRGVERSRSQSYDHYDKYYSSSDKLSSKSRNKHSSRGLDDERIRSKDRRWNCDIHTDWIFTYVHVKGSTANCHLFPWITVVGGHCVRCHIQSVWVSYVLCGGCGVW